MKLLKIAFLTALFVSQLFSAKVESSRTMPAIVTIQWLKSNINNPNLVVVDLREKSEYLKGHLKNAVNIPGLKSLFDEKFMMPKLDFLKKTLSEAGINNDSLVVAYDNGQFFWAARFYWILQILGHEEVSLLKVAYGPLLQKEFTISTDDYKPAKTEFIPRVDDKRIETKLSTLLAIGKKTIIDGRQKSHYEGKESLAKRFGHIPTAQNYACTQNYQVSKDGNFMKDWSDLKSVYKDLPKDKEIILYCYGGAEAALNYIVLQELGYKVSVYDGSWYEWGNDPELPIENPSK